MSSSFLKLPQLSRMVMHAATACGIVNTSQHALDLYRSLISGRRLLFSLILSFDEYSPSQPGGGGWCCGHFLYLPIDPLLLCLLKARRLSASIFDGIQTIRGSS